ncbi:NAD(P)H-binding protein [Enterococcus faecalis]|uniref:NAD(P)H-binding protein n=1 Tax=Enterococcus faecalis TaxID=1351 RepID=UPI0025B00B16|nr:NAD(P)H-binding protein [Enterococcus faecalis]MDN3077097.1 NAD(P)H-binding protein [Enterococcus faecalis]
MKIFVAGATGRVGRSLINKLVNRGHFIYAGSRKEFKYDNLEQVKYVYMDLHSNMSELKEILKDAQVVYFVAGSQGKDLLQTDLYGAVKLMNAAEQKGIRRYIQLSGIFSLNPEKWSSELTDYFISKFFSDMWLINHTHLNYTILQPGTLTETTGSGKVTLMTQEQRENSIDNVATVLSELLDKKNTFKKVITMADGEVPIGEALEKL